ncbi:MAG: hypothetical protein OIN87_10845 [Candidatus Methanoperedens sp.]|nr:hypothetical protein [Candidatus Methanoperedens sp.]
MKDISKYVTSIQMKTKENDRHNISIGFERNGAMRLCFQDSAQMGQNSTYINEASFPNSGILVHGLYSMWLSIFTRQLPFSSVE